MKARRPRRWRPIFSLVGLTLLLYCVFYLPQAFPAIVRRSVFRSSQWHESRYQSSRKTIFRSLNLDEAQCEAAFPGASKDVDDMVALGPFNVRASSLGVGPMQVRIKDGQLFVLDKGLNPTELDDVRNAVLHQLSRALVTAPTPLPDTVISLTIEDQPFGAAWTYSRPAWPAPVSGLPPLTRAFTMPHFSFWAWAPRVIGSLPRAAAAIDAIEATLPFAAKDPRAVWRGTTEFNSAHRPRLREDLLKATRGQDWADVQALEWRKGQLGFDVDDDKPGHNGTGPGGDESGHGGALNAMMIEDFCRYKYVLHTEGVTYSGRFQFLQMCGSVVLTPAIAWLQHTTHLVKPLFSSDLNLQGVKNPSWTPSKGEKKAWPKHYSPAEANIVFVAPDWSDLGATIRWLEEHPTIAERIARRQRELFVGGGYFSPAAEVCYWRALIRGWSKVVTLEGGGWDMEGVPWERFALGHET